MVLDVLLLVGSVSLADSLVVGGPSVRELPVVELPVTGSLPASVPLELALPGVVGWGSVALARAPSSLQATRTADARSARDVRSIERTMLSRPRGR